MFEPFWLRGMGVIPEVREAALALKR